MKFSLTLVAVGLLLGLTSSRSVKAACTGEEGELPSVFSFCDDIALGGKPPLGGNPPNGFDAVCSILSRIGLLEELNNEIETNFTFFAPTNEAFENLLAILEEANVVPDFIFNNEELLGIITYHLIEGSSLPAVDVLCSSSPPVAYGGKNTEGRLPKIKCVDDIVGRKSSFIVGPGNKAKLGNLPRLSRDGKAFSAEEKCNGIVYVLDNVILPKFVKKIIDGTGTKSPNVTL